MAYPTKTRDNAFRLFRKLQSPYAVGKKIGVHPDTIKLWREKYGWDEKITKIRKKIVEREAERALTDEEKTIEDQRKIIEQYAKDDADNLKILKAFKAICIDEINKYKAKHSRSFEIRSLKEATDVMANVIKLERLIKGESTEIINTQGNVADAYNQMTADIDEKIKEIETAIKKNNER